METKFSATEINNCYYWEYKEGNQLQVIAVFASSVKEAKQRILDRETENSSVYKKIINTLSFDPLILTEGMKEIILKLISKHIFVCDKTFEVTSNTSIRYYRYTPSLLVYLLGIKYKREKPNKIQKIEIDFDECFS